MTAAADYRRVRVDPVLEQGIHQFAVRDGRSFDGAARRLISLGLEAVRAQAARPAPAARDTAATS